jgi:hypothetical protein
MLTSIIGRDVPALDPDAIFAEQSLATETDAGSRAPARLRMARARSGLARRPGGSRTAPAARGAS